MQWFHHFFLTWMQFILDWGYLGIFVMMAFESTALPIPAEVVMPPAAYWASQGRFNLALVIVAATAGSWAGSAASYWIAYKLGRPLVNRYGTLRADVAVENRSRRSLVRNLRLRRHFRSPPAARHPPRDLHPRRPFPDAVRPLLADDDPRRRPFQRRAGLVRHEGPRRSTRADEGPGRPPPRARHRSRCGWSASASPWPSSTAIMVWMQKRAATRASDPRA